MNDWLDSFPKLNELYRKIEHERIKLLKSENALAGYIELVRFNSFEHDAERLEANLARLDSKAWEDLIEKILRYSCSKQKSSGRRQFWEHLNELRGYLLLKDRGYSEIEFIPEEAEERAEFIGKSPTRVILEVKTINRSDDDRERDRKRNDPTFSASKKVGKNERRGDIIDLFAFAKKLSQKSDPVSGFLWEHLDKTTQELLVNYVSDTGKVESILVENLNRIIQGKCIYEVERFRGVPLQPKTEYLLECRDECLGCCLNRCLLDDAYSQELSNWSKSVDGVEVFPPPDVPAEVPAKLLRKCEERIEKARSQIGATLKNMPSVDRKIVLLIINRDFGCSFITMKQLEIKLQQPDLEVVCQLGTF